MKKLLPGRNHISILPYAIAVVFGILTISMPKSALAACSQGSCTNNTLETECTYSDASTNTSTIYCCTGPNRTADCSALLSRLQTASQPTTGKVRGPNIDPNGNCGDTAINTALGCLSVDTKGFTSSLLTFLAGTAGAISLVIMLIATIQIMTGGDNAEQVKKGKELFTGAITGLLFIIFSVTLLRIVAGDIIQLDGFK